MVVVVIQGGGGRGSYGGRQSEFDKEPHRCTHCGRNNHIAEKCWQKFDKPEWAQLTTGDFITPAGIASPSSTASSEIPTVQISHADYEQFMQLQSLSTQNSHSATHASSSGINAYIASSDRPWILDSGASSHMT